MKFELPAIGYHQGQRQMVVTAMDPVALIKLVARPDVWSPLGAQPHGNRPQDKNHRKGIASYLEGEENFVLGSVVLYAAPRDALYRPGAGQEEDGVSVGTLSLSYGAQFDVGDGQHRIGAYSDVINRHDDDDPIMIRLRASGQPAVIVIDDDPINRAQDFTDLQRNSKPPTGSLGMSMDRRQAINRFVVELVQRSDVPLFAGGTRVEFLKDSPGKLSAKLFSFKTVRYVTGTALIGVAQRSTKSWEKAANEHVGADETMAMEKAVGLWKGLGSIPNFADVIAEKRTAADLRKRTLLGSAGIQYAMAYAIHLAHQEGMDYQSAASALGSVDFDRPARKPTESDPLTQQDTIFAGTLIDPYTGRIGSGRPAWEAAAEALEKVIVTTRLAEQDAGLMER